MWERIDLSTTVEVGSVGSRTAHNDWHNNAIPRDQAARPVNGSVTEGISGF